MEHLYPGKEVVVEEVQKCEEGVEEEGHHVMEVVEELVSSVHPLLPPLLPFSQ